MRTGRQTPAPLLRCWHNRRRLAAAIVALAGLISAPARADDAPATPAASPQSLVAGQLLAPKAFRAAAARVGPSLVRIESFGGVLPGGPAGAGLQGLGAAGAGPTTGVILSADGHIVTSTFNFLGRPPVITVILSDGSRHVATLLGRDDTRKICLLKIDPPKSLPVPEFVPRTEMKVGQWAISAGIGFGDQDAAISAGIISALDRINGRAVQTDANISPANYGGPLLDIRGRVLGICVPLSPQSKEVTSGVEWYDSGIGFAVPLAGADALIAQLKAGKTLEPATLGVQAKGAEADGSGAVIGEVQADSAAAKAGLIAGDRILTVDGTTVLDVAHLRSLIGRSVAGDRIALRIRRGDAEQEVEVTLQAGKEPAPETPEAKPPAQR